MGNFNVIQRTSDGYFNATHLLRQWNENAKSKPVNSTDLKERRLDAFWDSTNLDQLMSEIAENELNFKSQNFGDLKNALSKTCRGKKNGGTWMHPVLFIKFAMYLSPRFEYHVLKFVADEMIRYRNDAGDAYKQLSSAVMKIVPRDFMPTAMKKIAEALNWVIFNEHESGIRNKHGEENKQRELFHLETKVTDLINEGFIRSFDQLEEYLRSQWRKNWTPKVLQA
jgi:hypothetical protein